MISDKALVGTSIQFLLHGGEATPGATVYGDPGTTFPGLIHAVFDDSVVDLEYQDKDNNKQTADKVVDVVYFDQNGHARRHTSVFLVQGDAPPPRNEAYARHVSEPRKGDKELKTGTAATAGQATGTPPTTNSQSTSTENLGAPPNAQNPNTQQGKLGTVSIPKPSPDAVVPGNDKAAGNAPAGSSASGVRPSTSTVNPK